MHDDVCSLLLHSNLVVCFAICANDVVLLSDTMICTGCCTTLDHITTYLFKQLQIKGEPLILCVVRSFHVLEMN